MSQENIPKIHLFYSIQHCDNQKDIWRIEKVIIFAISTVTKFMSVRNKELKYDIQNITEYSCEIQSENIDDYRILSSERVMSRLIGRIFGLNFLDFIRNQVMKISFNDFLIFDGTELKEPDC